MNNKLDKLLENFAGDGEYAEQRVRERVAGSGNRTSEALLPSGKSRENSRKVSWKKCLICAASAGLALCVCLNFNIFAESVSKIISSLWVKDAVVINHIGENRLGDITPLSELDEASMEYRILRGPVETPRYLFSYYYKGYRKIIALDENAADLAEITEWLRDNAGIVTMIADTTEDARRYLELANDGRGFIAYSEIREKIGDCRLPGYLPKTSGERLIECNPGLGSVVITYFLGEGDDYLSLNIIDTGGEFGKNYASSLTVGEEVESKTINGETVYISDGYYVWASGDYVYTMYSVDLAGAECERIVGGMR